MTISPHTGKPKTQTSRLISPEWVLEYDGAKLVCIRSKKSGQVLHKVNGLHAVQPGRGKASVGKIAILEMFVYDVRTIPQYQTIREGFTSPFYFLRLWTRMHENKAFWCIEDREKVHHAHEGRKPDNSLWIHSLGERPKSNYLSVGMVFKKVE